MASVKLPTVLLAAIFAAAMMPTVLSADDSLPPPPPPGGDALPPPPGADAAMPPPPGADAGAPADASAMPPPPGGDASAVPPPPGGDASAMPPPPGGDASAMPPPPGAPDGGLQAPPTDKLFPDTGSQPAAEEPSHGKKHKHHKSSKGGKVSQYTVEHHDSLWNISAKSRVYGDAFQWPILFIANRDQIKDPDLIKPGWDLKVKRDLGSDEVSQAVTKAKDTPRYEPHTTVREKLPIDY